MQIPARLALLALSAGLAAVPASATELSVTVAADTFVQGGKHAARVFGEQETLLVGFSGSEEFTRVAFLRFELPKERRTLERATLRLRARNPRPCVVMVSTTASEWEEDTLAWRARPEKQREVGALSLGGQSAASEIEMTEIVRPLLLRGGPLALRLDSEEGENRADIVSREGDPALAPVLVLRFR